MKPDLFTRNLRALAALLTALFIAFVGSAAFLGVYFSDRTLSSFVNERASGQTAQAVFPGASRESTLLPGKERGQDEKRLVFVGDIMLSRKIGELMREQNDWMFPFAHVREFLASADLVFGNLEGPISGRGQNEGSIYSFNADTAAIKGLRASNISVVSIANNHIFDYGDAAFLDTLAVLGAAGVDAAGGGVRYRDAHRPVIRTVGTASIAFLAYTDLVPAFRGKPTASPAVARPEISSLIEDIEMASVRADIVVVSFHWGDEYETQHNAQQEEIARIAIDHGAALVVGHHPHVVQEVEPYKNGYIAYSLGNFVFDQNFSPETARGLALEVFLRDKKISRVNSVEVIFNEQFQPMLAPTKNP